MSKSQPAADDVVAVPDVLPVLPVKDAVVFPYIILPLSVSDERSIQAVDRSLTDDRIILLVSQRPSSTPGGEELEPEDGGLFSVGTAASIMRMLKLPDGRIRILVQGLNRVRLEHIGQTEPFLQARVSALGERQARRSLKLEALVRSVREGLERAVHLGRSISPEVMVIAANLEEPGRLADLAASNLDLRIEEAQALLENLDPVARLRQVSELLQREIQVLTVQHEISSQARGEMDRNQREYFLRQQLKAIQQELGESDELAEEVASFRKLASEKQLSEEAVEEMERQIRRLERSHPDSAETTIIRTYLDWLTGLPWQTLSEDQLDLAAARQVLDEEHYGLEKIKERILEYLAVRKLRHDPKGPLLCFVGPPGVGKTSLGRSIARTLGRKFIRISLGGVRDEAEIRGHRRTYVGALPGRVLQGVKQAGTSNPVFMLDEIDKIGSDYRGDPSSALLEVLDPEQNFSFRDHYLGVAYDLSRVLFIATANLTQPIQPAFLDRMEVLKLSGYTAEEKLRIARRHLIPKQRQENGLEEDHIGFTDAAIRRLITDYTKEAGLRNLERELAAVCRKVAVRVAEGRERKVMITPHRVETFLGPARHFAEELLQADKIGVATGLAWTAVGGDLMFIEVIALPAAKGQLTLTGQLGDVMKESAQAALSYARAYATRQGIDSEFFSKHDIHVHLPAGSIPKDGPSAGITIATAIISLLVQQPVHRRVAMTGEITLRGDVLPIGGLKEKVLAARSAGIHVIVLPKLNHRDLSEIAEPLKKGLDFRFVEHMNEVLEVALVAPEATKAEPEKGREQNSRKQRGRASQLVAPPGPQTDGADRRRRRGTTRRG